MNADRSRRAHHITSTASGQIHEPTPVETAATSAARIAPMWIHIAYLRSASVEGMSAATADEGAGAPESAGAASVAGAAGVLVSAASIGNYVQGIEEERQAD